MVLGADGKVAEQGNFKDLSTRPDGAFTKLMEWQMSGGEVGSSQAIDSSARGPPTEKEQLQQMLEDETDLEGEEYEEVEQQDFDENPREQKSANPASESQGKQQ